MFFRKNGQKNKVGKAIQKRCVCTPGQIRLYFIVFICTMSTYCSNIIHILTPLYSLYNRKIIIYEKIKNYMEKIVISITSIKHMTEVYH